MEGHMKKINIVALNWRHVFFYSIQNCWLIVLKKIILQSTKLFFDYETNF